MYGLSEGYVWLLRVSYTEIDKPSAPGLLATYQPTALWAILGPGSDALFEVLLWLSLEVLFNVEAPATSVASTSREWKKEWLLVSLGNVV